MLPVYILDKDSAVGEWVVNQLGEIDVDVQWVPTVADLLSVSDLVPPVVCLVALRPPVNQTLTTITDLTQEPRFARTVFILMGPNEYKHTAFEAGADDYIATPPDVIELRKRVRLYLDRAELELRVMTETRITQEIESLEGPPPDDISSELARLADSPVSLLEHAAWLERERNRYHTILEHASAAISLVSLDGVVQYMNPATEQLTGQSAASLTGQAIPWPPQAEDPARAQSIARAVELGNTWQGDVRYTLGDRTLHVAISIAPVFDTAQDLRGFVVIQRDVARRRADQQLRTRFLADAAIEMRTPVTNLKMRQYLLRQAPSEQQDLHLQSLERETDRLYRLVEAMLELSRLDAGLQEFVFEDTEISRLVSDVIIRYTPKAEKKDVTLALPDAHDLPPLRVDQAQIARAIGILIDNAVLYTPEGGHIEVVLSQEHRAGDEFIAIQVQDTGLGIFPDDLPHIFERFYRSERARDSGIRGVGMGLAIANEIVERHQGCITVDSQANQGSLFTVWLPVDGAN